MGASAADIRAEEKTKRGPRRNWTPSEWLKARTMYETGDYTVKEIADKFGRNKTSLSQRFKRFGVKKGTNFTEASTKVERDLRREQREKADETVKRAKETKEEHYKWARSLSQMAVSILAKAQSESRPIGMVKPDILAVKAAMEALQKGQDMRNIALGLDKGDILDTDEIPEFGIVEMTEDERLEVIRKADSLLELSEDMDITTTGEGEREEAVAQQESEVRSNMERLKSEYVDDGGVDGAARIPGHDA